MSAEEELTTFRLHLKEKEKQDIRRARSTAAKFGVLATASLIALVFAFFQQTMANKSRMMAEGAEIEASRMKLLTEKNLTACQTEIALTQKSLDECQRK